MLVSQSSIFQSYWPSLLKVPSFLVEFMSPIVKVSIFSKLVQILAQLHWLWNVSWGKIIISHLSRQLTKMGHNYHFIPCLSTSHGRKDWRAMPVGGLRSTIRFACAEICYMFSITVGFILLSVFCLLHIDLFVSF